MRLNIIRVIIGLVVLILIPGCSQVAGPFRTTPVGSEVCNQRLELGERNNEGGPKGPDAKRQLCSFQNHILPEPLVSRNQVSAPLASANGTDGRPVTWQEMATENNRNLKFHNGYQLAFVEMDDQGKLLDQDKLTQLLNHLKAQDNVGVQNFVVVYVHGWRNDADLRNTDVKKLRRLLGYSRAALNTRCIVSNDYCNATLTGVFIGWNGRTIDEGEPAEDPDKDQGFSLGLLGSAVKFWDRHGVSCYLGSGRKGCGNEAKDGDISPLLNILRRIEKPLSLVPGDPSKDKLLIFGHSLGGNMLAVMMGKLAKEKVEDHTIGTKMKPIVGDLVVLLNPAGAASNWNVIQSEERSRVGLGDTNQLTCLHPMDTDESPLRECANREKLKLWHRLYPVNQRPIYISLTSAADWGSLETKGRAIEHDNATGQIYPVAIGVTGENNDEFRTAIGHWTPEYSDRFVLGGNVAAVGTSHEVAVLEGAISDNGSLRYRSKYVNAARPASGWCAPADGWLYQARSPSSVGKGKFSTNWDTYGQAGSKRNIGGSKNLAAIQWRQGMYLQDVSNGLSVSSATSPFWNVRALDTVIRGHAGWANYPIWCALNQLVLDDVTSSKGRAAIRKATPMREPHTQPAALQSDLK